ncbi:MAG: type II toxin-antitoxin system Phd/YefM family antitoxin [Acidobacteriota bacterium]
MQSINATELKSQLAHYLQQAQQGNEIVIKERNRIIARLVPPKLTPGFDEELLALAAQGKAKLPEQPLTTEDLAKELKRKLPRMKVKGEEAEQLMKQIWAEERGED